MKSTSIRITLAITVFAFFISCNPSKKEESSTEIAKEANDENFESRKIEKDADFIVDAVAGNYGEVKLAQVARNKSTDGDVKDIAIMLEADHTNLINELKGYANKKGISIPLEETDQVKKDIKKLYEETGVDFDKKWCSLLVDRHEKTIMKFEDRWNKTEDNDLKDWINSALPILKSHLETLKAQKEKTK